MRKLVLHIGCPKGGSSAIQAGLRLNCEALAAQGVCVPMHDFRPGSHVTGSHGVFFDSIVSDRQAQDIPDFGDLLDAQADESDSSTIVVSAENLGSPVGFEKIFGKLRDRFNIRIVMYVRRQDDFLESAWQQWEVKRGRSLLCWMIDIVGRDGDWENILAPWAETFGDDHIVVRVFDREQLVGGDAFRDFCTVLEVEAETLQPTGEVNVGLSPIVSRLVEGRKYLFDGPHDAEFYDALRELAGELMAKDASAPPLFSADEAEAIMDRYRNSNERLRQRFLPDVAEPLFPFRRKRPARADAPIDIGAFERELLQLQILNLHRQVKALGKQSDHDDE